MELNEARSTRIMDLISELKGLDFVDRILDVRGMSDGFTVFLRGKDGNAYELEIRPASGAKGHEEMRKADKYADRVKKKRDDIRKGFGY